MTDETMRWRYGLFAVSVAVTAILGAFVFASIRYKTAGDVSTALAAITGTLGTILGGYLGVQTGSFGKEEAERARQNAENRATAIAAVSDPDRALEVLRLLGESQPPAAKSAAGVAKEASPHPQRDLDLHGQSETGLTAGA